MKKRSGKSGKRIGTAETDDFLCHFPPVSAPIPAALFRRTAGSRSLRQLFRLPERSTGSPFFWIEETVPVSHTRRPLRAPASTSLTPQQQAVFQRLRLLRMELSKSLGIPPYAVFTDATLREICIRNPRTEPELLAIPGVGEHKLHRFGQLFLEELRRS